MTLIVAVPYRSGLIVGADRRVMRGPLIQHHETNKLHVGANWVAAHYGSLTPTPTSGPPVNVMAAAWAALGTGPRTLDQVRAILRSVFDNACVDSPPELAGVIAFAELTPGDFWYVVVTSTRFGPNRYSDRGRCTGVVHAGETWPLDRLLQGRDPAFVKSGAGLALRQAQMSHVDAIELTRGLIHTGHLATNYFANRVGGKSIPVLPVIGSNADLVWLEHGSAGRI